MPAPASTAGNSVLQWPRPQRGVGQGRAAHLAQGHHQGLVQQAALVQVGEQRGRAPGRRSASGGSSRRRCGRASPSRSRRRRRSGPSRTGRPPRPAAGPSAPTGRTGAGRSGRAAAGSCGGCRAPGGSLPRWPAPGPAAGSGRSRATRAARSSSRRLSSNCASSETRRFIRSSGSPRRGQALDLEGQLLVAAVAPVGVVLEVLLVDHGRQRVVPPAQPAGILAGAEILAGLLQPAQRVGHDGIARQVARRSAGARAGPGTRRPSPSAASRRAWG